MRLLLASLFFILLSCGSAQADPNDPYFIQQYDNRNGLSNSAVNSLLSDASNLLWVGTWDGLNLYNGSTFHVFNYSKEGDNHSIGSNVIRQLREDKRGNIWIVTIEGISRYQKQSGNFYHYFYNRNSSTRISEDEYTLAIDSSGAVYCFNKKTGLTKFDEAGDRFITVKQPTPATASIHSMFFDRSNWLWLLDNSGVLTVIRNSDRNSNSNGEVITVRNVNRIFNTGNDCFYTTTDNKLFHFTDKILAPSMLVQLPTSVGAIAWYNNRYLLAWTGKGCASYTPDFLADDLMGTQTAQLQNVRITSFTNGSEDILWCGTDGNGIIKLYPKTKPFGTIATTDNSMPYNRSVRAFCSVNNDLWVGTKGSGILVLKNFIATNDNSTGRDFIASPELDNNSVYAITRNNDGLIYIGTDAKGINIYDEKTHKLYKWNSILQTATAPEFGSVYAVRADSDGSVWLGTSGYGLIHLKITKDKSNNLTLNYCEKFPFRDDNTGPANDIIYALADASDGRLWIGCRYGGLSLLDKKTKRFTNYKAFAYEGSLSNNDVLSIFRDTHDRLWIGTSYGLNWLDSDRNLPDQPEFHKLTMQDGLPNNTIHAIEQDSSGNIWISSNKGLACINNEKKISYYQQVDGLQSNEFCDGAVWKDDNGRLYFGGIYGFNQFLPKQIRRSSWQPNLLLSSLVLGDEDQHNAGYRVITNVAETSPSYTVTRNLNYFDLDVQALSFLNAEKCEYAYILKGYDKQWRYAGTNNRISYSNLSPGGYSLWIKWSNGDGSWSRETEVFALQVQQYFWLRWYAWLFYSLVAASIAYILYRYRKNRQEAKHQLELEHLLRQKDEIAHQSRIGFFTNIAHELQTPLTLIMGSAERFRNGDKKTIGKKENGYFLSLIHQQASKLTYLVHQLLDFRKAEAGFLDNHFAYLNITALLQNLADAFTPLSEKNNMEYEIHVEDRMTGWVDQDKLEKIIYNLLSNAFRYASNNETINFSAVQHPQQKQLEITVSNPCKPLSPEEVNHLFDQFYTATPAQVGKEHSTGIGLAFTQQMVSLLQGKIDCRYENERISFIVALPVQQDTMIAVPAADVVTEQAPSELYAAITEFSADSAIASSTENNKQSLIEKIEETTRKNILIVEDDPNIRFLVKDVLQDEYIVHEAIDGLDGLAMIPRIMPDLVICDVMMPNLNGLELCNRVKNAPATCHIPFLILSARGSDDHHLEGYTVGADAYLAKPFQTTHLKTRVKTMIEYRQKLLALFNQNEPELAVKNADLPADDKQFLAELAKIIEAHLEEEELSAQFLERQLNLSKMQLYRRLKTLTGMTPGEFIRNMRLKHAATLLVTTGLSVTEIFYRTGFNNQSYFFREFKKKYQYAPNEYREMKSAI